MFGSSLRSSSFDNSILKGLPPFYSAPLRKTSFSFRSGVIFLYQGPYCEYDLYNRRHACEKGCIPAAFIMALCCSCGPSQCEGPCVRACRYKRQQDRFFEFHGESSAIEFLAPWCAACKEEMADLNHFPESTGTRVSRSWRSRSVHPKRRYRTFSTRYPLPSRSSWIMERPARHIVVSNLPQTFILGRDGDNPCRHAQGVRKRIYAALRKRNIKLLDQN